MIRRRIGFFLALSLLVLAWPRPAAATLVLLFDESTYTIPGVGKTTNVEVLVEQTAGGTQVSSTNPLLTAAVELSFPTSGAAVVTSSADVTPNPAWSSSAVNVKTSGSNTLIDLGLTSLAGFGSIPSTGLLLGTFTFTGESLGSTTISVSSETPGSSFGTPGGDVSPTNTPTATINVVTAVVAEPAGLTLLSISGSTLALVWLRRRTKAVGPRP
jgi:hypothetical protein